MDAKELKDKKNEYLEAVKQELTPLNILVYTLMILGLAGLGLLNWATLSFDISQLTVGYAIHFGLQVISYASIITATSTNQLTKRKRLSGELYDLLEYIRWVLMYYRPEKLQDYIYQENLKTRKDVFLSIYRNKLESLEKKNSTLEAQRSWRNYIKKIKDNPDDEIQPPNDYCELKTIYLDKIENWKDYYLEEYVNYDEIIMEDLTINIGTTKQKKVPRRKEATDLSFGVAKALVFTVIGGVLVTVIVANFQDDSLNGFIKTAIVAFFVLLSAIKGNINGDRVFENTTLEKAQFRRNQLHGYVMYEATENKYIFPDIEEEK